ncbi:MAG: Hsp20/alpha crystallin family protein [Halobacteriovoraceae bacterium]|nr:Hsp20/alpha crystallin family protein [Halobacteriovoraceae bacterium]MCB9094150.1 Hsp20/alpha crystallin family protein [Halobacteriovoraceae bacterium]
MSFLKNRKDVPVRRTENLPFGADLFSDFDAFFKDWKDWGAPSLTKTGGFTPALNIKEDEDSYVVETELPGVNKEDIHVEIQDNVLMLKGEKKSETEENKDQYHRIERSYGSFYRSIGLPKDIDAERVNAKMDNGVLTVTVDKLKEPTLNKRKIEIS